MALVFSIGINDIKEPTRKNPFYVTWHSMLRRCYDPKLHERNPAYKGATVCDEWALFSTFKKWMLDQDWQNKHLDKDILVENNSVYSPNTCIFVPKHINNFFTDRKNHRGPYPVGTYFNTKYQKYLAYCRNPISKKKEYIGSYDCPKKAHLAWKAKKHQHACMLASTQKDERIIHALKTRYLE